MANFRAVEAVSSAFRHGRETPRKDLRLIMVLQILFSTGPATHTVALPQGRPAPQVGDTITLSDGSEGTITSVDSAPEGSEPEMDLS